MNDRLKYKVFDKRDNKLKEIKGYTFSLMNYKDLVAIQWSNGLYEGAIPLEDLIFCSCTGRKDRNGKDIYENDIVEFTHSTNIKCRGVIKFLKEDAMFAVVYKNPRSNKEDWDFMSKFTLNVIGNIYTTPELLEGKC